MPESSPSSYVMKLLMCGVIFSNGQGLITTLPKDTSHRKTTSHSLYFPFANGLRFYWDRVEILNFGWTSSLVYR